MHCLHALQCIMRNVCAHVLRACSMLRSKHWFFKLLQQYPQLFTEGSLFTAGRTISYLQSLGLTTRDISAHIIPKAAEVLLCDLETVIQPVVDFLMAPHADKATSASGIGSSSSIGNSPGNDVTNQPHFMETCSSAAGTGPALPSQAHNPDPSQQPAATVHTGGLGLNREQLCSVLSRAPHVLLMSVSDLLPRITFLRSLGCTMPEVSPS